MERQSLPDNCYQKLLKLSIGRFVRENKSEEIATEDHRQAVLNVPMK